ncbi:MAG: hypothetical protein DSY86_08440 [Marinomonas sp.]|nr:MAG: hypothetical protein DSY86_08440 [Marinomonas sp.]RUM55779.1 MAG: hypothetical protein DSY85_04245 [Marinomonas sp.]
MWFFICFSACLCLIWYLLLAKPCYQFLLTASSSGKFVRDHITYYWEQGEYQDSRDSYRHYYRFLDNFHKRSDIKQVLYDDYDWSTTTFVLEQGCLVAMRFDHFVRITYFETDEFHLEKILNCVSK